MRTTGSTVRILGGLVALAGTLALTGAQKSIYTKHDKAFYLDQAIADFVRPGIVFNITGAQIAADGTITATFTITDPAGLPLEMAGIGTPGPVTARFLAAYIPNGQSQFVAWNARSVSDQVNNSGRTATQATLDSGGTFNTIATGQYTYTFKTKAVGFDPTATTRIGGQVSRDLTSFGLTTYGIDAVYTFVPNGSTPTNVREVVLTQTCNGCHDPLAVHGGARQKVEYCIMCHTPQSSDPETGNTVDFKVMIHKIHMGEHLPSVKAGGKYEIIGFNNSVTDFSDVTFPQDPGTCKACHQPGAAQANNYLTQPTAATCGSCHDDVNLATGLNHPGGPQPNDKMCANCHIPQGELEFDASIIGAHTNPNFSNQLPGIAWGIEKVDNGTAGQSPTVTFSIHDKLGNPISLSAMGRVALVLAGPTSDYASYVSENAIAATGGNGEYMYTFKYQIPATATGTYTVGIEGTRNITLNPGTVQAVVQRDWGLNKTFSFSVDGTPLQARRQVVALDNCNKCHGQLLLHGNNRSAIEQCVLCHNPNDTDAAMRPVTAGAPQTVDFRTMIHKIHTGDQLTSDFTIYGFGGSVNNFNHVTFPGDRRDCAKCHVNESEDLPLSPNLLPVVTPRDYLNPTQPETAACLACHTEKAVASHALANTTTLGESCDVCHGTDGEFSVDKVHAR